MRIRLVTSIGASLVFVSAPLILQPTQVEAADQASTASVKAPAVAAALQTPWGEPDLQGIWTDETDTPLQRSPKYAEQEFFTEAQRQELDQERSAGRGPHPATKDTATDFVGVEADPLQ